MDVRRRYLALTAMRWLPNGLLVPVFALVWVDRGLTLGQIGWAFAVQAVAVFALELPTGGLADALGRRPVLIGATLLDVIALAMIAVASSFVVFASASLMMGVYRALESGPLDAWLIDELDAAGREEEVEAVLGAGGVASGLAIAAGALASAGLVAIGPVGGIEPLVVPLVAALGVRLVDVGVITALMRESRVRPAEGGLRSSLRAVPTVIADTLMAVRSSRVLLALIGVELLWGFGMVTFETLVPVRLAEVAGGTERAAAMFGPAATVAWIASAAGSWAAVRVARRTGAAIGAVGLQIAQAATIVGIAAIASPITVIAWYLLTMGTHGALNPLYKSLLNAEATASNRTTVMSAASMAGFPGFALGGVVLGAIADTQSVSVAMMVGAVGLCGAAALYVPAVRQDRRRLDSVAAR